jgi:hypothetical protein
MRLRIIVFFLLALALVACGSSDPPTIAVSPATETEVVDESPTAEAIVEEAATDSTDTVTETEEAVTDSTDTVTETEDAVADSTDTVSPDAGTGAGLPRAESTFDFGGVSLVLPRPMTVIEAEEIPGVGINKNYSIGDDVAPTLEDYRAMLEDQQVTMVGDREVDEDGSFILSGGTQGVDFLILFDAQTPLLSITAVDRVAFDEAYGASLLDTLNTMQEGEILEIVFDGVTYNLPPNTEGLSMSNMGENQDTALAFGTNNVLTAEEVYEFMSAEMTRLGFATVIEHNLPTNDAPYLMIEWQGDRHTALMQFGTTDGTFNLTLNKNSP